MSAGPPFNPNRVRDSLSILAVCQSDPFGGEFKQVDAELIRRLDPFIGQCLEYLNLPSKEAKVFKCYDTDKGRFLGLSARTRLQRRNGCIELSPGEQITILFVMALYRTDREGSSELVPDPVESCNGNANGDYDSPRNNSTSDYLLNRHGSHTENLLEKVQEKIMLIKDNLTKYFARDYDYDTMVWMYKNWLLRCDIDYTDDVKFMEVISQMSVKTKGVSDTKVIPVKPKNPPVLVKRRKTISQAANLMPAPLYATAEQPQIRPLYAEAVNASAIEYPAYQQYPTPNCDEDYLTSLGLQAETAPTGNFTQLQFQALDQAEQNILAVANQGTQGAVALFYAAPDSQMLFCCLKKLHEMFERHTGQRYFDLLAQSQGQALHSQAVLAYSTLPNINAQIDPLQEMNMAPQGQYPDGFQQIGFGGQGDQFPRPSTPG